MSIQKSAPRVPLNRARVLAAGVALADTEGLDEVSMRSLSTRLGVVPMALYKHVADKEDLIDGMVDEIVADYGAPPPGISWREAVRARVLAARGAFLMHPWLRSAIETRTRRTETVLAHMDAVAGELIGGGVSVDLAHHAMHALGHRIWGFSPEAFDSGDPPAELAQDEQEVMIRMMASRFPHVAAIAMETAAVNPVGACDEQFEFEFTLDLLLDAFERLHEAGWSSRPRT